MNDFKTYQITTLLTIILTPISFATDINEGKKLYEQDCTKCHDSSVFTRNDRKIKNLDSLKKQVMKCATGTGASWFDEDNENVTAYLSKSFYQFNEENKQ